MTISVNTVTAAGSVQIIRPKTGIEPRARNELPPVAPAGGSYPSGPAASPQVRHAQALSRLDAEHRVADLVKHTDASLREIGQRLGQMRDTLQQVIKQYPPYPLESRERMEFLNSLSGLRKQIDALTLPPPNREPVTLIGDPSREPGAGDLTFTLDGEARTLHAQPAHSGAEGLDLPELAPQASMEEVEQAYVQVQQAQQRLDARRAALAEELETLLFPRQDMVDEMLKTSRDELAAQSMPITGHASELGALK